MGQSTEYYRARIQLAKKKREGKMLPGNQKRKTGSGPILEKMRMLEITDSPEEDDDLYESNEPEGMGNLYETEEPDGADNLYETEESDDAVLKRAKKEEIFSAVQFAVQSLKTEILDDVYTDKKKKKKKAQKQKVEEQTKTTETIAAARPEEKHVPTAASGKKDTEMQMLSGAQLQNHMIWAEILGEPVSVKRRKKRVEQLYGNQGHAYRR